MNRARNNGMNNMNGRVGGVTDNNGLNNLNGFGLQNGTNGTNTNDTRNGNYMNGTNRRIGRNPNGQALSGSLAEQIRALCFVKTELELYLDTHPGCRTALDYYYQTVEELKRLTEEYENTVGPLTAMGNVSTDQWHWVDGPWPWHQAGDFMREGDR